MRLSLSEKMKLSFSQYGEDLLIGDQVITGKLPKIGFYVDIGAFHPTYYSNTCLLYLIGWNGINIDASPKAIALFNKKRPDDLNIESGISNKQEKITYYSFQNPGMNTFSLKQVERLKTKGIESIKKSIIQCRLINEILEEALPHGKAIDYINIDLEGFDELIVKTLDWNKYKPTLISVEMLQHSIETILDSEIYRILKSFDYKFISFIGLTAMFLKNDT